MENKVDTEKLNKIPRYIRVEIAEKIQQKVKVDDYDISKNAKYQKVCEEVGKEYGLTMSEVAALYLGWDAYKKVHME